MRARHRPTWLMNQWSESSPMSERRSCSVLLFGVLVSRPFSYNVVFYIVKMRALKRCNAQNVSNVSLQVSIKTTPRLWLCRFSFIQAIVIQGLMSVCDSYRHLTLDIACLCSARSAGIMLEERTLTNATQMLNCAVWLILSRSWRALALTYIVTFENFTRDFT